MRTTPCPSPLPNTQLLTFASSIPPLDKFPGFPYRIYNDVRHVRHGRQRLRHVHNSSRRLWHIHSPPPNLHPTLHLPNLGHAKLDSQPPPPPPPPPSPSPHHPQHNRTPRIPLRRIRRTSTRETNPRLQLRWGNREAECRLVRGPQAGDADQ